MGYFWKICLFVVLSGAAYAKGQSEVMVVMDMSGSMYGKFADKLKLDYAREALAKKLQEIAYDHKIGLVVMGAQKRRRGCRNYRQVIPLGVETREQIAHYVLHSRPRGKTPLSQALQLAVESFSQPNSATIMLVSDGQERCGKQGYATLEKMHQLYPEMRMDIVSLATKKHARERLVRMAVLMRGNLYEPDIPKTEKLHQDSNQTAENDKIDPSAPPMVKLFAALPAEALDASVKHEVYTTKGIRVLGCKSAYKKECTAALMPGTYIVHSYYQNKEHTTKLRVLAGMDAYLYTSFKEGEDIQTADDSGDDEMTEDVYAEAALPPEEIRQEEKRKSPHRRGLLGSIF